MTTTLESIRKPQILDAAVRTMAVRGSNNVTLDDIAKAAGLSKGGITHYYGNKDLLCKEAFREFFDRIFLRSKETMEGIPDPVDRLLSFDWLYDENDPDANVAYPLVFECMALASRDADYRELFHDWVENWVSLLKGAIEQGVDAGRFEISDPEGTARTISAIYQGIAARWYLDRRFHSREWALRSFRTAIGRLLSER
jgi:AcrR family transcriptional regulator